MLPPSQHLTKHHVMPGDGDRWSISFRRVIQTKSNNPKEWPYFNVAPSTHNSDPDNTPLKSSKPIAATPRGTLFFDNTAPGDSFTDTGDLLKAIQSTDLMTCRKLLVALNSRIQELEVREDTVSNSELENITSYTPDFPNSYNYHHNISVSSEMANISTAVDPNHVEEVITKVMDELNHLNSNIKSNTTGVDGYWLLNNDIRSEHSYLKSSDIGNTPAINELLQLVNEHDQCVGELNSCQVLYYPNGSSATRCHSDDEPYLSQTTSICNVNLGAPRVFAIYDKHKHDGTIRKSITVSDKSLLIMQPEFQHKLKHKLCPDPTSSEPRWCLSFRCLTPIGLNKQTDENTKSSGDKMTVILGTSITTGLKTDKLAGPKIDPSNVVNLSVSGAKIRDISDSIDNLFAGSHKMLEDQMQVSSISNLIISVGTNDIRFKRHGVKKLYTPIIKLLTKTRKLFPSAKVYVQCCIPIALEYEWTIYNVEEYNKLLRRCCKESRCLYLDVFNDFLDEGGYPRREYYRDNVHLSSWGLGILARSYIKIVRNVFDPRVRFE